MKTKTKKNQKHRKFSEEEKMEIVKNILNRPSDMKLNDACEVYGIQNPTYYEWKKRILNDKTLSVPTRTNPTYRFNDEEKRSIITEVENHPKNVTKLSIMTKHGVAKPQYYEWRRKFGVRMNESSVVGSNMNSNVRMTQPTKSEVSNTKLYTMTLTVEVRSIMELITLCNSMTTIPMVKSVVSVE